MRICFFGDSLVLGYGDPEGLGWAGRLCLRARAQGYDVTCYNLGVRRASSADVAAWWRQEADHRIGGMKDGAVVFSFGTVDTGAQGTGTRLTAAQTEANMRAVLTEATGLWPALFIAPPKIGDDHRDADTGLRLKAVERICAELKIPFFDGFAASDRFTHWVPEVKAGDGVHPGAKGHNELADVVETWASWRALLDRERS